MKKKICEKCKKKFIAKSIYQKYCNECQDENKKNKEVLIK